MQSINLLSQTFCKYSKFSLPSPRNPRAVALTTMHIILDNGHGLKTPGKRSPDGTLIEAIYTRQLVKYLASELEKLGHTVHILVPEPEDIPLNVRVKRINGVVDFCDFLEINPGPDLGFSNSRERDERKKLLLLRQFLIR